MVRHPDEGHQVRAVSMATSVFKRKDLCLSSSSSSVRASICSWLRTPIAGQAGSGQEISYTPAIISRVTYSFMHSLQNEHLHSSRVTISSAEQSLRQILHSWASRLNIWPFLLSISRDSWEDSLMDATDMREVHLEH